MGEYDRGTILQRFKAASSRSASRPYPFLSRAMQGMSRVEPCQEGFKGTTHSR